MEASLGDAHDTLSDINVMIDRARGSLEDVFDPVFTAQGALDEVIDPESANVIHDGISTDPSEKRLKFYENSGHVLTIDEDKKELFDDIYGFMEEII